MTEKGVQEKNVNVWRAILFNLLMMSLTCTKSNAVDRVFTLLSQRKIVLRVGWNGYYSKMTPHSLAY